MTRMAFLIVGIAIVAGSPCSGQEPKLRATLKGHALNVVTLAFNPDGTMLASGSHDHTIKLWDMKTGEEKLTMKVQSVRFVGFSPDGNMVLSVQVFPSVAGKPSDWTNWTVKQWEAITGKEKFSFKAPTKDKVDGFLAVSPDGMLLASARNVPQQGTIKVWDVASGEEKTTLKGQTSVLKPLQFSADGALLASVVDKAIRVWDVKAGTEKVTLKVPNGTVESVSFSPDGTMLASVSQRPGLQEVGTKTVTIWDLKTAKEKAGFRDAEVHLVAFNPDGAMLVSASTSTMKLWDARTGKTKGVFKGGHSDYIHAVTFSPDGTTLASASKDKTIMLWDVPASKK